MFPFNLGRLGNGISLWLGISPYELFFYIFLPPLLCDSAVRIDFFLFKQVCYQCLLNRLFTAIYKIIATVITKLAIDRWRHQ